MRIYQMGLAGFCAIGALGACGGGSGSAGDSSDVNSITLAVTSPLPPAVQCVSVSASTSPVTTVSSTVPATAPWTQQLALGSFTSGSLTITASAYNLACASVTATSAPSWVADPVTLSVTPGRPNTIPLNFRQNLPVAATDNFIPEVVDFSVGFYSTGFVLADGTVKLVGNVANPSSLTNVAELALGTEHACARKADGTIWCWGTNGSGEFGNGTTSVTPTVNPVQVPGIANATRVVGGLSANTCAIAGSGTLWNSYCWGVSWNMQVFGTSSGAVSSPQGGSASSDFSIGTSMICAINSYMPTATCWGYNGYGALGNGSTTGSSGSPVNQPTTSIGTDDSHTCVVDGMNRLWCVGDNSYGELGNGTFTSALTAVQIPGSWAEVVAGNYSTCARNTSGAVYCWGYNYYGQVGNGTLASTNTPQFVNLPSPSKKIRAGGYHNCSMQTDNTVYCWGENQSGQLGDGTLVSSVRPIAVKL